MIQTIKGKPIIHASIWRAIQEQHYFPSFTSYLIPMLSSAVFESLEYFSISSFNDNDNNFPSQFASAASQRITQGDVPVFATASNQYDRLYGKLQHQVSALFANFLPVFVCFLPLSAWTRVSRFLLVMNLWFGHWLPVKLNLIQLSPLIGWSSVGSSGRVISGIFSNGSISDVCRFASTPSCHLRYFGRSFRLFRSSASVHRSLVADEWRWSGNGFEIVGFGLDRIGGR